MDQSAPRLIKPGKLNNIILFEFYKKPMASRTNNLFRGGIPLGSKIATGTQEVIRRLKNTSRELEPCRIEEILSNYMQELREGGYPLEIRMEMLNSGIKGYTKMWKLEFENKGFVNRPGKATLNKHRS